MTPTGLDFYTNNNQLNLAERAKPMI